MFSNNEAKWENFDPSQFFPNARVLVSMKNVKKAGITITKAVVSRNNMELIEQKKFAKKLSPPILSIKNNCKFLQVLKN